MKVFTIVTLASTLVITACASPTVIQTVKPGDTGLSCAQLQNEYSDAERFKNEADKEKGMTGGNVARAIFFWPAILGSFSNANEAMAAADARKIHMANLMSQKNCAVPVGQVVAVTTATAESTETRPLSALGTNQTTTTANSAQSQEERLKELKRLHDNNLISKEVYLDRQKSILGTM